MWVFVVQSVNNEYFVYVEGFQYLLNDQEWVFFVSIYIIIFFRMEMIVECSWENNEVNS